MRSSNRTPFLWKPDRSSPLMNYTTEKTNSIPLIPVSQDSLEAFLQGQSEQISNWVKINGFKAKAHEFCVVPDETGRILMVLFGLHEHSNHEHSNEVDAAPIWSISNLAQKLPVEIYHLECDWEENAKIQAETGWGLGAYKFEFFKKNFLEKPEPQAKLRVSEASMPIVNAFVDAYTLVRDLVNTPPNHMMPEDLSALSQEICQQHGAEFDEIVGDDLLKQNFPAVHAVGRASDHKPRFLKLNWASGGSKELPLLTLIGKGVCFDTGGLDIKQAQFMRYMKKDMGGAAHVLGLAHLIMSLDLPVQLQVFIPAVDNAISGDAYRPGDIIDTRAQKTVEIDNTDAEGRVVLGDALTLACETDTDLILDFATLTGAARVAVGTEIPALFSNNNKLLNDIQAASEHTGEVVWPLPLHQPYFYQLKSDVADLANCPTGGYAGAITAALYLNEFVDDKTEWAHFDVNAWNVRDRPGRPKGGEAMGLLATFNYLQKRYVR